jgi:hypothetical protein
VSGGGAIGAGDVALVDDTYPSGDDREDRQSHSRDGS